MGAGTRRTGARLSQAEEWAACCLSPAHFLDHHAWLFDAHAGDWCRFRLWSAQREVAAAMRDRRLLVILKARQLGLSWLACGFALWLMVCRAQATVLLFSRRDAEAVELLAKRLRQMYQRLPDWMAQWEMSVNNDHELRLSNGSAALAFPTTGGRSYTAALAIVDEADFVPDLDALLNAVKPTIDGGGRLILLSTVDKGAPGSAFKRIFRAAQGGENDFTPIFLPWSARPGRTEAWYQALRRDILARTGSLDNLYQEYPASEFEALAPRSLDKRFASEWLAWADATAEASTVAPGPSLPGLQVYEDPLPGHEYVIGADPAEGNPQSDESAASVVDVSTGTQVACWAGRFEPAVFAAGLATLSEHFRAAGVMVERNNHGHAVLLWLGEHTSVDACAGLDGKPGWLESGRSKPLAMDNAADMFRDRGSKVRDRETLAQLSALEGRTLAAPAGGHDDRAMAHVLALAALRWAGRATGASGVIRPVDPIALADAAGW